VLPYYSLKNSGFRRETRCTVDKKWRGQDSDGGHWKRFLVPIGTEESPMIISTKEAPYAIQEFRMAVRKKFRRGVNAKADLIIDDLIVWLVHDLIIGEIDTHEEAAEFVAAWMNENFPEKSRKRS
jgi:hypothetical protein